MDNNITYSSSMEIVDPQSLFTDGYELTNQNVIESQLYRGTFTPGVNNVEFYIYDANKTLIYSDYNFTGYYIEQSTNPSRSFDVKTGISSVTTSGINLDPEKDIATQGFTNGEMYAVYNFVNLELGSSLGVPYYLAEISSDRTEVRLKSNLITTSVMKSTVISLRREITNPNYFDEVYLSFGNNEYHIGVNMKYDDSINQSSTDTSSGPVRSGNEFGQSSILIKLFDPLPLKYDLLDTLYVATKTAESQAFLIDFLASSETIDTITNLRGPNSNLKLNDFVNGVSVPQSKRELLATKSSGSKDQLLNRLSQTGIQLTPNYSTASFGEFVNFSSAKSRVSNFVEKISRIQAYEADINTISSATGSNVGSIPISESISTLWTKIEEEIIAFDGFDYYQYYTTASDAYPKTGTVFPLTLLPTASTLSQEWITATETSASLFDNGNQNWLYYTIPDFIKDNTSNNNYLEFVNMVGQSFDELWLYTKALTEKLNTTNDLDKGIPLQLADDVITSLGYAGFGNNYNNADNFTGLIGSNNGDYLPPTGSELITQYIAINGPGGIVNYWDPGYSFLDYVDQLEDKGFPYPIDRVSKEIFKRLYHNMSYLVKKKGTISGLRQLINIWGIPNTILRINEFGGKNKDEEDDYDLWYQRYSYAYTPVPAGTNYASSSIRIPYQPLYRNYIHSHNKLITSTITATGTTLTGATPNTTTSYEIDTQFTVTGGGSGGTLTLTADGGGNITTVTLTQGDSNGYNEGSIITITAAQVNALSSNLGTNVANGPATFIVSNSNLGAEQIVPDGLGFRFKSTGYPSSSFGGTYDSQSLFIKKSTNTDTTADFGIILNYTGSTSGSHSGSTSSAYKDYGEMRFFINGSQLGGDTALSPPIYLPFFDKGWWNVQLQRDQHPIVTNNNENTTYTLYVANKIYDGADGNQLGFQGSASIYVNVSNASPPAGGFPLNANSASLNKSWNDFSIDLAQYGAGAYVGGWGNTLTTGETGSMGILSNDGGSRTGLPKGIQNAGKNFSGSLQEFRYYSNDISQSVFNDAVMNPESIEGNFITGSESSFDIVNFRAPLGNELESRFTSSEVFQYTDQKQSVHPAITGSSPLIITASFYDPATIGTVLPLPLTSSYDVTYNANSSTRTYSDTNVETYFLDQPSIGIRNRVSNKIKYSTNLNFGTVLSNRVSIQQDPPASQSYTDNINSLEVAFSPTEEVNDDIIQSLGYGSIQEVIADPRFRSSSDDYYPGLKAIAKDYFKKYMNRSQVDYLRLIKYFDDSLFRAIKNYVPARTSVSTGIVIKQNMLERSRYREPQVNIVTTQSYAPFNQPLTAKNLELTGSIETNQLWDPLKQTTFYSSSDVYTFSGGPGGSVNQYNILEEGGGLFLLESDNLAVTSTQKSIFEAIPLEEANKDIVLVNAGTIQSQGTASIKFGSNTTQTTTAGNADADHSIVILSINPSDGSTITKSYCTSNIADTGTVDGAFVRFRANGSAATTATQFAAAINSVNGQGSGASTPTLTAIVDSSFTGVILTQLYGGTDGNTLITYGNKIISSIGNPTGVTIGTAGSGYTINQTISLSPTVATIGAGTGLTVNATTDGSGVIATIGGPGGALPINYAINDEFSITNLTGGTNNGRGKVAAINTMLSITPASFAGGTSVFSNTFLNVFKSIQTPIYIDYDFTTTPLPSSIIIEGSSSIRGIVYTNTTSYSVQDPVGSILVDSAGVKQYLDIHPGEDMYLLISSPITSTAVQSFQSGLVAAGNSVVITGRVGAIKIGDTVSTNTIGATIPSETKVTGGNLTSTVTLNKDVTLVDPMNLSFFPAITIDDYNIILGESIIITTSRAAQTTTNSNTLLLNNLSDDDLPTVGSTVTGPDIKGGVVTVLGAVTNGGTGYDPSVTQVLATSGAGGGNLTLDVTTNSSGVVTTASLVGGNPGTNYTSGDIITIVGGNNDAKVEITTATAKIITVAAFDPTNNQVTFNEAQTVTNNTKVTFTATVIPDADTIPLSQQGYFNYNITNLGVDTVWDSTQEQFYDGEYSGSDLNAAQFYNNQYNPYRKVKGNSLPIAETSITVNTANGGPTVTENPSNAMGVSNFGTGNELRFAFASAGEQVGVYPGITNLELIPYQTYEVEFTLNFQTGGGTFAGIFYENYGYNNSSYGLYPQTVSGGTGTVISGTNTGYAVNGSVATTPPATRLPTVSAAGTGYIAGTFGTTGGNGAGQTVTITVSNGNIATVTLVNPGSGYIVGDLLTVVGGNNDGIITPGAGGVVIDITEVDAVGAIQNGGITIRDGGNGLYQLSDIITITGGDGTATFTARGISSIATNGVELLGSGTKLGTSSNELIKFRFQFLPPLSGDTSENGRYGLSFYCLNSPLAATLGTITGLKVTGIGGIYEKVEAPIFLNRQDKGYDNQRDYQNMGPKDILGNVIGGSPTGIGSTVAGLNQPGIPLNGGSGYATATDVATTSTGIGTDLKVDFTAAAGEVTAVSINAASYASPPSNNYNIGDTITITGGGANATFTILSTKGEIDLIQNTQSVVFNNSDFNALNNNVNTNRSSSNNRYVLSYGSKQNTPNNFAQVVTAAYFPTSVSGSFPEKADVPDSNYTMPSSINARYNGTKLSSLNYNFFTPSGSVGPEVQLPIMPVNRSKNPIGFKVANEFLDGSSTSSFDQTTLGAGSSSWAGDSRQNSGSSTIDKHPIYMARFENSYEQLNMYDSYQFNIDQLIQVPFENIAGEEITPNSITIDGSNENKKIVSSVFEPKRKVSVSYLNPKTPNIDYTTMTIGNFDILSGATEFLTINSNAKSRVSGSRRYQYELGGTPYTASAFQTEDTIQMVTGSNTIPAPGSVGNFDTNASLTKTNSPTVTNNFSGTIIGIPVQSTSGGAGATVDIVFLNGGIVSIIINQEGSGYNVGGSIYIDQGDINAAL